MFLLLQIALFLPCRSERPEEGDKPYTEDEAEDVERQANFDKVGKPVAAETLHDEVGLIADRRAETA